jgi:hypothetical protein
MDQIPEFVDERNESWCIHCGAAVGPAASRDHVPSRCLLLEPYPTNLPTIRICASCNSAFSRDEEYTIAFLGSVLVGSTEPDTLSIPAAARILRGSSKLRERIARSKIRVATSAQESRSLWKPEDERIKRVVVKNARGHAFFEFGDPLMGEPFSVLVKPLEAMLHHELSVFLRVRASDGWPEVGARMMTRMVTGQDMTDGWVIVQPEVYRYSVVQTGTMTVRSVLFEYLATEVSWDHG